MGDISRVYWGSPNLSAGCLTFCRLLVGCIIYHTCEKRGCTCFCILLVRTALEICRLTQPGNMC
ncbi:hypothetical protein BGX38DRAFT_1240644 [Terfezia claveryi]|nr:hypothetical protein BGX38DRAFT_1240644 [Terfezia claveryi]